MVNNTSLAPVGEAFSRQALATMSGAVRRQTGRAVEQIQAQAIIADVGEQARALLASSALQNVGALTALEQHLIRVAPLGEARYKHIVDAYALGAATTIQRW